jgi:hypothetical protein
MRFEHALRPVSPFRLDCARAAGTLLKKCLALLANGVDQSSQRMICLEKRKIPITFAETVVVSTPERSSSHGVQTRVCVRRTKSRKMA